MGYLSLIVLTPLLLAGKALEEAGRRFIGTSGLDLPIFNFLNAVASRTVNLTTWTTNSSAIIFIDNQHFPLFGIIISILFDPDVIDLQILELIAVNAKQSSPVMAGNLTRLEKRITCLTELHSPYFDDCFFNLYHCEP